MNDVAGHIRVAISGLLCGALCMIVALVATGKIWSANAQPTQITNQDHTQE